MAYFSVFSKCEIISLCKMGFGIVAQAEPKEQCVPEISEKRACSVQ
jgi:hypothetical protein